jgi:hypothetical protein
LGPVDRKDVANLAMTGDMYGSGKGEYEGIIGVSEIGDTSWNILLQGALWQRCRQKDNLWFHPEALEDLQKKGITKKDMFFALNSTSET